MEEEKRTERPRNRPGISAEQPKRHVEEQSIAVSIYAAWSVLRVSPWLVKATGVQSRFDPRTMPGDLRRRLVKRRAVTGSEAWTSKP